MDKLDSDGDTGDLGLGDGLKPGGLRITNSTKYPFSMFMQTHGFTRRSSREDSYSDSDLAPAAAVTSRTSRFLQRLRRRNKSRRHSPTSSTDDQNVVVSNGDVRSVRSLSLCSNLPTGTTVEEHMTLHERNLKALVLQDFTSIKEFKDENGKSKITELDNAAVKKKLQQTEQEVEQLKQELELCEKQLDAKYKAIKILQGQVTMERHSGDGKTIAVHNRDVIEKDHVTSVNRELQKEINSVQFELEYRQSCLLTSQEVWTDRFDRVCQENISLARALEQKSLEMKKLHAEKMAFSRERDELLALVDIQERHRFESLKSSQSSEDSNYYNNFSTIELAVLGACQCRVMDPDPCGCAHAAAAMKRDIGKLKQQIVEHAKKLDESAVVTDTYRVAFDEQLGRNRELIRRLGDLTLTPVQMSKTDKAKGAIKWLIKQLNEGIPSSTSDESILPARQKRNHGSHGVTSSASKTRDLTRSSSSLQQAFNSDMEELFAEVSEARQNDNVCNELVNGVDLDKSTEDQLLEMLAEMVSDKTEALIHSRLTAKVLAKRNRELEQKLKAHMVGTDEVFHKS